MPLVNEGCFICDTIKRIHAKNINKRVIVYSDGRMHFTEEKHHNGMLGKKKKKKTKKKNTNINKP